MARLPIPGNDVGSWGGILNEYLQVEHNSDGTLKKAGDIAQAKADAQSALTVANDAVPLDYLDSDSSLTSDSDAKIATQKAVKEYVDNQIASGSIPDATASTKGKIKLAGDIGGTADVPTIPALSNRVIKSGDTMTGKLIVPSIQITGGSPLDNKVLMTDDEGNATWKFIPSAPVTSVNTHQGDVVLDKTDIGLSNVDNTSDVDKPISSATNTALSSKEDKASKGQAGGYASLDGSGTVPVSQLPNQSGSYVPITAKGAANGVAELDGDARLPTTQLPELIPYANLPVGNDAGEVAAGNDTRIVNAIQNSYLDTDNTLTASSDTKLATQKATKEYVDNQIASGAAPDATTGSKGIVQLAGDLGGTAEAPTVKFAGGIKSATTNIATSGSAAPSSGQFLRASNSNTASWQAMPRTFGWYINGGVTVGDGQGPVYRLDADARIIAFDINAKGPPASVAEFDVQITNNPASGFTSIFTIKPTIATGQYIGTSGTLDTITLNAGVYIRFCVVQPGGDGGGLNVATGVTAQLRLQTR